MASKVDLLFVVDDTDIIKLYRNQILDALDCVYPKLRVHCQDISMKVGGEIKASKLILIVDAAKHGTEDESIISLIGNDLSTNKTKCLVITLTDPTNVNDDKEDDDKEQPFNQANIIHVQSMTEIEKWWPVVINFVFPNNQNERGTSFAITDNSKSSFSEQKKIHIQKVLQGFGCNEDDNLADVKILIEETIDTAKEHIEQVFPTHKQRSKMKNVHICLLNANKSQVVNIHGVNSVHGYEQILRLILYCMIDVHLLSARRSPSKVETFLRRIAAVVCILLNIPLLAVWVAVMFASVIGATLLYYILGHKRVISVLLYFIHMVFAMAFIALGCVLLPEEYRKSNDIRLSTADVILVCFVVVPLSCCVWGFAGCFFMNRNSLTTTYVFGMPGLLWSQFEFEIIDNLSTRVSAISKYVNVILQKVILTFAVLISIVLNIPLLVLLFTFMVIGPIASLIYLHFLIEVAQIKSSAFYHFGSFQSSGLISTASLVIGIIFSRYKMDFWNYGDSFLRPHAVICPYRRNCYTSYENITISHDQLIIIFCIIIPLYFLVWVSFIGFIAENKFQCKYGVLSIPNKVFSKIIGNAVGAQ